MLHIGGSKSILELINITMNLFSPPYFWIYYIKKYRTRLFSIIICKERRIKNIRQHNVFAITYSMPLQFIY